MTKSKVADAKISAEARKTVEEERRRRSAGITAAESCHAAQQTVSLWAGGELEFQRWYGNSKTRSPPGSEIYIKKKRTRAENISRVYVKPKDAALSESNGVWSETSTKESRAAESQVIPALRSKGCADGIRTWKQQSRVGRSERPGQMQAKEEEEEAIKEKRYNFTTAFRPSSAFSPQGSCASRWASERAVSRPTSHRSTFPYSNSAALNIQKPHLRMIHI